MNAPRAIKSNSTLLLTALERLAAVGKEDAGWTLPTIPFDQRRFDGLADKLNLSEGERISAALLYAVEADPGAARIVGKIQHPVGGARPLAGLLATLFSTEGVTSFNLWSGKLTESGLLRWGGSDAPLPEQSVYMPPWLVSALSGGRRPPPGLAELQSPLVKLSAETRRSIAKLVKTHLGRGADNSQKLLVLRGHCPHETAEMAQHACRAVGLSPYLVEQSDSEGLASWLQITGSIAVVRCNAGPGEEIDIGIVDRIDAPVIVLAGLDGRISSARTIREYAAEIPDLAQRASLWRDWGVSRNLAAKLAARYRQSAGRISEIGRAFGSTDEKRRFDDIIRLMRSGGGRIDALARLNNTQVERSDIVLPNGLALSLDALRDRILLRNGLADNLGPTLTARYRPGVRSLFSGESGTGKTLAASWLAAEAGLPLYRVDLSAMTSKWIGETEKNISDLLDTAEQGDVMLFFDEADSLFGSRTDVSDAHDRYANAQTNFLLQRIEDYTGVAILATNSRDRFDPAFARRLDMVLEFPLPDPVARRVLWDCHLGSKHAVEAEWLDEIAGSVELAGGHIRNVVLAASARARARKRPIEAIDISVATIEEYDKLGRSAPPLPPC